MLLILAFPGFELACVAWFALVPLLWAVDREKESLAAVVSDRVDVRDLLFYRHVLVADLFADQLTRAFPCPWLISFCFAFA